MSKLMNRSRTLLFFLCEGVKKYMNKRLYVAYGSNLNIRQMKHRCPGAKLYGTGEIKDYELQFKGQPENAFATIAPKEGSSVPVAVWEIQPRDEMSLDRYEGYPSHYFKQDVPVQLDGEEVNAMVYIMNLKMGFGLPSPYYYQTVYEGYNNCGLNTDVLNTAVKESAERFYADYRQQNSQQTLSDTEDENNFLSKSADDDEYEPDEDEQDADEDDSFYFSGGMQL